MLYHGMVVMLTSVSFQSFLLAYQIIESHGKIVRKKIDEELKKLDENILLARAVHERFAFAKRVLGIKRKMFAKKRYVEKALMKKT
ncbi:ribosome biogenesis protein NSA2 homolog [Zingiber officinale]|uniref:ribosome biogenesis protein NSA2 homolog n=1 Tax=Zingiber officinale TaxID=94328 RepID=UPI001C4DD29E|nr:ribosome biogenesis protein NSA2 homolog [Zingiber officinale]